MIAPGAPDCETRQVLSGIPVRRFRYSPFGRERLAVGVSGIIPNIRARPTLAMQVPAFGIQMMRAARSMAAEFDIVHAHWLYPSGLACLRAAQTAGVPLVVTAHGGDVNAAYGTPGLRSLAQLVGNRADRVLAVSEDLSDRLLKIGVDASRVTVVPLGVNVRAHERTCHESVPLRVVFVGSLIKRKSVATLIDALQYLPSGLVDVHIVGGGPERSRLEDQAMDLSIEEGLVFHGPLPPTEVQKIVRGAGMLVLPSLSEGGPWL